jgi:hypothetical protein
MSFPWNRTPTFYNVLSRITPTGEVMKIPTRLLVGLLLVAAAPGVRAGEPGATFRSRLSCPYSSFVVGEVTHVDKSSITVKFTKNLLRKPVARSAIITFNPKPGSYQVGEKLLVNCWDFPPGKPFKNWIPFPSSFYRGKRHCYWVLARIGKDNLLQVDWPDIRGLLNWLYATGNWKIRIVKTSAVKANYSYDIIYPNGKNETLTFNTADYPVPAPKAK